MNTNPIYLNCTFTGNVTDSLGGPVYNTRNSSPQFINCIVWNNSEKGSITAPGASISNDEGCFPVISHSLITNSGGSANWDAALGTDNGNNIDLDPLFVLSTDPGMAPNVFGSQRLQDGFPALNAGDSSKNTTNLDLAGAPRIEDTTIYIGAYKGVFDARFETFHPGLDPSLDNNGNGLSNYRDYALGSDHLSLHDSQQVPNLEPSGNVLYLTLSHRVETKDVFVAWEGSYSLDPDSWFLLVEGVNFQIQSTSTNGIQKTTVLGLPYSPAQALFYRQVFSIVPF